MKALTLIESKLINGGNDEGEEVLPIACDAELFLFECNIYSPEDFNDIDFPLN